MPCSPTNLSRQWATVLAVAALAYEAGAQQQSIIYSKPTEDVAAKANAFLPPPSSLRGAAGAFNAPGSLFGNSPAGSFDVLPGYQAPRAVSPEEAKRWQKVLDNKKKWTLLTPEEILGVTTVGTILGVADSKNDEKLTIEERFLMRQTHGTSDSATNGRPNAALLLEDSPNNPFRPPVERDRISGQGGGLNHEASKYFDQFKRAAVYGESASTETSRGGGWTSSFQQPLPVAKPDPARVASMERLRALLDPPTPPDKPVPMAFAPAFRPLESKETAVPVNPAGRAFAPLSTTVSKPARPMGLPAVTASFAQPVTAKPGTAQLPPWLQNSTQPPETPQRRVF